MNHPVLGSKRDANARISATRPKSTPGVSIIDLTLTTLGLGPLPTLFVDRDHPTGLDHEVIVLGWDPLGTAPMEPSQMITGWQIQALQADKEALEEAAQAWKDLADKRPPLSDNCLEGDIAGEAIWI